MCARRSPLHRIAEKAGGYHGNLGSVEIKFIIPGPFSDSQLGEYTLPFDSLESTYMETMSKN